LIGSEQAIFREDQSLLQTRLRPWCVAEKGAGKLGTKTARERKCGVADWGGRYRVPLRARKKLAYVRRRNTRSQKSGKKKKEGLKGGVPHRGG